MPKLQPRTVRGWTLALGGCVVAAVLVSGSRDPSRTQEPDDIRHAREEIVTALRAVDARLRMLAQDSSLQAHARSQDSLAVSGPERLRARHDLILATLDSLEGEPALAWRGALPGLRAALADLEYRTDIAQLMAADSVAELDELLTSWLAEVRQQLNRAERERPGVLLHRDAFDESRRTLALLNDRLDSLRGHTGTVDVRARRSLARDLAVLRREVRALIRSIERGHPADSTTTRRH